MELADIAHLLAQPECRLLTLTGPGGIGKTRLALEAARELEGGFRDGAHFVELESLSASTSVVPSVASALGLELSEKDPLSGLLRQLKDKQLLLVLDNYEHLLEGAALASDLFRACPHLKVLATSRERLNLEEERLLPIGGLAVPEERVGLGEALAYDAVQLFVQQARRVSPHFEVDEAALSHVLQICRLVEGHPLGLELAAVWVRALPVADLAREVGESLDLLSSDSRNANDRHKSIRAAFEHSWRLLSLREQDALARLSVIQGGFTREAASYVADAPMAVLAALVDKSLLRLAPSGRYHRHPLIHQYTQEKLTDQAVAHDTQRRHAAYYLETMRKFTTSGQQHLRASSDIEDDFENTATALAWSTDHKPESLKPLSHLPFELAVRIGRLHRAKALLSEATEALKVRGAAHDAVRGCLMIEQAFIHFWLGELIQALSLGREGLTLLPRKKDLGELNTAWIAFIQLLQAASMRGEWLEAKAYTEEALALAQQHTKHVPSKDVIGITLGVSAEVELSVGNYTEAEARAWEAVQLLQECGQPHIKRDAQVTLSKLLLRIGKPREALSELQKLLVLGRELREEKHSIANTLISIALAFLDLQNHAQAKTYAEEALQLFKQMDLEHSLATGAIDPGGASELLTDIGRAFARLGDLEKAEGFFYKGLSIVRQCESIRSQLYSLVSFAGFQTKRGQAQRAAEILYFVLSQPTLRAPDRDWAKRLLDNLAELLELEQHKEARSVGEQNNLDSMLQSLVPSGLSAKSSV